MSDKLTMALLVALPTGLMAGMLLIQHQTLSKLREENLAHREQLEQLVTDTQELSNRLFQATLVQPPPQDPPRELLRLRNEVGMLRRRLQELEQLTNAPSLPKEQEVATRIETAARLISVQTRAKAAYERWKSVSEQVRKAVPDPAAQIQTLLASGYRDTLLNELLEQRQLAARKNLSSATTDLDEKLDRRLEGIRLGLEVRAAALDQSLRDLETESGAKKDQLISALERLVNDE